MGGHSKKHFLLSIRNRIVLFAVLATLLPSLVLGWLYFRQSEETLLEGVRQEMLSAIAYVEREFDLWFKERHYEIRVFSNSYLVSEGLAGLQISETRRGEQGGAAEAALRAKLESYLDIVHSEFAHYRRLSVFDPSGEPLAEYPRQPDEAALPADWEGQLEEKNLIVGKVLSAAESSPSVIIAVPVLSGAGSLVGLLAAETDLSALGNILQTFISDEDARSASTELLLIGEDEKVLLSTREQDTPGASTRPVKGTLPRALQISEYTNFHGDPVIGIRAPLSSFPWSVVIEKEQRQLFSTVIELRNRTMFGAFLLATVIGLFAYLLSRGIISPLERLTEAAAKVAGGDLSVNVPVTGKDELGAATQVFNEMVEQLRQSRQRLEQLSTTDSLTQLANRKHTMEVLTKHLQRFRRNNTPFSVLLVDADHFKQINDSGGHLAGDEVLRRIGGIFRRMLRSVDLAGRYGGEEFLIVLDETRGREALQTAERIRMAIETSEVRLNEAVFHFTVSIGVAEIGFGEDEDQLIMRADTGLYQAKQQGRNRSVLVETADRKVAHHPAVRKTDRT